MGKTKKQKRKEQDFRKPKLKVGKKRPAADNETKVTFKAASIQLATQLREKVEPTNRRRLTLQDLLTQLNHYNASTRQGALDGLKELFLEHPHVMSSNLGKVITKIIGRLMDVDKNVRKSFMSCLLHIIQNVSDTQVIPFTDIIVAHLKCAMTHINEDIQIDAVNALDYCLRHLPHIFTSHNTKFLATIVGLITRSYKPTQDSVCGTKPSNSQAPSSQKLKVFDAETNPGRKMSTFDVKCTMLSRIEHLLQTVVGKQELKVFDEISNIINASENHDVNISLYHPDPFLSTECFEPLSSFLLTRKENQNFTVEAPELDLSDLVLLIPVLVDCWKECSPFQFSSGFIDKALNNTVLQLMSTITSVLKYIVIGSTVGIFTSKGTHEKYPSRISLFMSTLQEHFLKYYPYITPKQSDLNLKKGLKVTVDQISDSLLLVNLNISEILCLLLADSEVDNKTLKQWIVDMVKFLKKEFECGSLTRLNNNSDSILKISNLACKTIGDEACLTMLLRSLEKLYRRSHSHSNIRVKIVNLLLFLVQSGKATSITGKNECTPWLQFLAGNVKTGFEKKLYSFYSVLLNLFWEILRQNKVTEQCTKALTMSIVGVFEQQAVKFAAMPQELQIKTVEMIYHIPHISLDLLKNLSGLCHNEAVSAFVKKYLINIIFCCSPGFACSERATVHNAAYLSFIISVMMGHSKDSLMELQIQQQETERCLTPFIVKQATMTCEIDKGHTDKADTTADSEQFLADHMALIEACLDGLRLQTFTRSLGMRLHDILENLMAGFLFLPEKAILGILSLVEGVLAWTQLSHVDISKIVSLITPLISSSILFYESRERLSLQKEIQVNTGKAFNSDLSRLAVLLLNKEFLFMEALLLHWGDLVSGASNNNLCVWVAEALIFLMSKLSDQEAKTKAKSFAQVIIISDQLKNRQDLVAELAYYTSVPI